MDQDRSALANVTWVLCVMALIAVIVGPLAIHAGIVAPFVGFRIFSLGLLASLPILLLSLAALLRTRGPARRDGRRVAVRSLVVSVLLVALFAVLALPGMRVPPIHDITTDPTNPPTFVEAPRAPETAGQDFAYPQDTWAEQQAAYPDVKPVLLSVPPADAYARAQAAATALGWNVVRSDPAAGAIEATSTSRIFEFVDDVSIRVTPDAAGSRVDVRSRSRVGKSDMGVNAARILALSKRLTGPAS